MLAQTRLVDLILQNRITAQVQTPQSNLPEIKRNPIIQPKLTTLVLTIVLVLMRPALRLHRILRIIRLRQIIQPVKILLRLEKVT